MPDDKSAIEISRHRLYPSLRDPNYLVLRARRLIFQRWFSEMGQPVSVLDVGGRHQPYRRLLGDRIRRYVAIDLRQTGLVNVIGDAQRLPFAPETFDLVISTQVFDCLPDPRQGALQVLRVLKPRGVFIMSVPAFAPRFADYEHWRFTPAGLKSILAGFERIEIVPEVSNLGGLLRSLNLGVYMTASKVTVLRKLYEITAAPLLNVLGVVLEASRRPYGDEFAPNYSVRALRPADQ